MNGQNRLAMSDTRYKEVDVVRAVALMGICIVNVPFMGLPLEDVFFAPEQPIDKLAAFIVEGAFQLKFFLLFSFVFGWGVGIQERSAQKRSRAFRPYFFRRLAALALMGCAHAVLVFSGDILLLYALLGVLLWKVRHLSPTSLVTLALLMVPTSLVCLSVLAIVIDELLVGDLNQLQAGYHHLVGGFGQASLGRLQEWPATFVFLFFLQGPLAMGAFSLGLAAERTGFFEPRSIGYGVLKEKLPLLLFIAVPTNLLYAATLSGLAPASVEWLSFIGFIAIGVGAPTLAAVYLYLLIRWARRRQVPSILLRAGRNSLSVYVLQGALSGLVFGGYGLGLFDDFGLFALFGVSISIAVLSIVGIGCYTRAFNRGPLEVLLRFMSGS